MRRMPGQKRVATDSAAKARLYHAVKDAHLAHIVRVDLKNELFAYDIDHNALALAELMDGKLLLVTNTPDLSPANVVARDKSLADIERGFRVLKSARVRQLASKNTIFSPHSPSVDAGFRPIF